MKILVAFLILIGIMAGSAYWYYGYLQQKRLEPKFKAITINNATVRAELADTPEKKIQGLSGRQPLKVGEGMLFTYDHLQIPGFWMKDMQFAIDIIWIRDSEILGIDANVPFPESPDDELKIYRPPKAINYVLEVPAGWVAQHAVETGQQVMLK